MYLGKVWLYPLKCLGQTCKAIHLQINVLFLCREVMFQFSRFTRTQLCLWSFPASANTWITHRLKDKGKKYVPWWCHLGQTSILVCISVREWMWKCWVSMSYYVDAPWDSGYWCLIHKWNQLHIVQKLDPLCGNLIASAPAQNHPDKV